MNLKRVCVNFEKIIQFKTESPNNILLLLKYMKNGDLFQILNSKLYKINFDAKVKIAAQIFYILHVCHSYNMIIGDVKLSNFLINDDGSIRLTDLGTISLKSNNQPK